MPRFQPEEMLRALEMHRVREPAGTSGYAELSARAIRYDLGDGLSVPVAALEDVIRSKEAANREKDRQVLPALRLLLQKRGPSAG